MGGRQARLGCLDASCPRSGAVCRAHDRPRPARRRDLRQRRFMRTLNQASSLQPPALPPGPAGPMAMPWPWISALRAVPSSPCPAGRAVRVRCSAAGGVRCGAVRCGAFNLEFAHHAHRTAARTSSATEVATGGWLASGSDRARSARSGAIVGQVCPCPLGPLHRCMQRRSRTTHMRACRGSHRASSSSSSSASARQAPCNRELHTAAISHISTTHGRQSDYDA